jgi:hypothetical protein
MSAFPEDDGLHKYEQRPDILRRGEPAGYSGTVATTWSLAFGRVEQSVPSAVGLLRLLACCAPEPVPLSLLLQPRPGLAGQFSPGVAPTLGLLLEDMLAADDAIAALRRYSLVTPAGDGLVSVHRLVRAVKPETRPRPATSTRPCWQSATGSAAPSTATPSPSEATSPGGPAKQGIGPRPGTSTPRCCPCKSECSAPTTPTP